MSLIFSFYRNIEIRLLSNEKRKWPLLYISLATGILFLIQNNFQIFAENNSEVLYILAGFLCIIIFIPILKNPRTGLVILVITLPIHLLPGGYLTQGFPVKSLAFYMAFVLIITFALNLKKFLIRRTNKLTNQLAIAFVGIFISIIVSILFAPKINILPLNFMAFKEPGSVLYILALAIIFALCLCTLLIIQIYGNNKRTQKLLIDSVFASWAISVIAGVIGLISIIFGMGSGFESLSESFRPVSTFYSVTSASGYIAIFLPLAMYKLAQGVEKSKLCISILIFLLCLMAIMVIIATTSRSGFIISLISISFSLLLFIRNKIISMINIFLLLFIIVGGATWKYPPNKFVLNNIEKMPELTENWGKESYLIQRLNDNNTSRVNLIKNSLTLWLDNPISGVGFGAISNHVVNGFQLSETHNFVVTIIVEQGILGVVAHSLFLIILVKLIFDNKNNYRKSLEVYPYLLLVLVGVLIHNSFHLNFYTLWCWVAVGISISGLSKVEYLANSSTKCKKR